MENGYSNNRNTGREGWQVLVKQCLNESRKWLSSVDWVKNGKRNGESG